jgi:hypothetical protein
VQQSGDGATKPARPKSAPDRSGGGLAEGHDGYFYNLAEGHDEHFHKFFMPDRQVSFG